ncbi:hypothetical protein NMY22_g7547 [Coprinellus aureogranulatus]|nr:hypothetical protein NMY22_g7547 [Coprinellus aureogranulatus]
MVALGSPVARPLLFRNEAFNHPPSWFRLTKPIPQLGAGAQKSRGRYLDPTLRKPCFGTLLASSLAYLLLQSPILNARSYRISLPQGQHPKPQRHPPPVHSARPFFSGPMAMPSVIAIAAGPSSATSKDHVNTVHPPSFGTHRFLPRADPVLMRTAYWRRSFINQALTLGWPFEGSKEVNRPPPTAGSRPRPLFGSSSAIRCNRLGSPAAVVPPIEPSPDAPSNRDFLDICHSLSPHRRCNPPTPSPEEAGTTTVQRPTFIFLHNRRDMRRLRSAATSGSVRNVRDGSTTSSVPNLFHTPFHGQECSKTQTTMVLKTGDSERSRYLHPDDRTRAIMPSLTKPLWPAAYRVILHAARTRRGLFGGIRPLGRHTVMKSIHEPTSHCRIGPLPTPFAFSQPTRKCTIPIAFRTIARSLIGAGNENTANPTKELNEAQGVVAFRWSWLQFA